MSDCPGLSGLRSRQLDINQPRFPSARGNPNTWLKNGTPVRNTARAGRRCGWDVHTLVVVERELTGDLEEVATQVLGSGTHHLDRRRVDRLDAPVLVGDDDSFGLSTATTASKCCSARCRAVRSQQTNT